MNKNLLTIFKEFYYFLAAALVVFCLLESVWPGVVLAYININWLLIFWLVIGIVILINTRKER